MAVSSALAWAAAAEEAAAAVAAAAVAAAAVARQGYLNQPYGLLLLEALTAKRFLWREIVSSGSTVQSSPPRQVLMKPPYSAWPFCQVPYAESAERLARDAERKKTIYLTLIVSAEGLPIRRPCIGGLSCAPMCTEVPRSAHEAPVYSGKLIKNILCTLHKLILLSVHKVFPESAQSVSPVYTIYTAGCTECRTVCTMCGQTVHNLQLYEHSVCTDCSSLRKYCAHP